MIATKEQEEYIRANIEKAIENCNDSNDRWYWGNVDLDNLEVIYAKLDYLDLVNLTKDDYDLIMEWAEDV
jgi:hypothetical protein